jgi:hypothetical protein
VGVSKASAIKESDTSAEFSTDPTLKVIGDREWLEQTAYRVVRYELLHCPSLYDALHLLQLLAEENISLVFSFDG